MSDPITDLKQELLAAAERQQEQPVVRAGRGRLRGHLGRRLLLASAALSNAAAVTLLLSAPWSNSPSFLARAEAALTPPPGTILHMTWRVTSTSTDPACTVRFGPSEFWIDQAFVKLDVHPSMKSIQQKLVTKLARFVFEAMREIDRNVVA